MAAVIATRKLECRKGRVWPIRRGRSSGRRRARAPGVAAAGEAAVVGERFGEAHADAGADRSGQPDEEGVLRFLGGDRGGEDRGERGDGAVHQAGQAGLHDLQDEEAAVGFVLCGARRR